MKFKLPKFMQERKIDFICPICHAKVILYNGTEKEKKELVEDIRKIWKQMTGKDMKMVEK